METPTDKKSISFSSDFEKYIRNLKSKNLESSKNYFTQKDWTENEYQSLFLSTYSLA